MINSCLITGAYGFLGKYIYNLYIRNGYNIETIGRSDQNSYTCDLSLEIPPISTRHDIVIHNAGKAHMIPRTPSEKQAFFDVNLNGTKNLLKGLEKASGLPKYFVFISSVSVYGRDEGIGIDEGFPLLASDPYGKSKIEAEKVIMDWCKVNGVNCTILRIPLLVGLNPPGNLEAMIKGIKRGYYFNIGKGQAKKSMVLAEDVADIIPFAAEIGGIYNLTDGYHPSFKEVSNLIASKNHRKTPRSIPHWFAKILAKIGDTIGDRFPINTKKLGKIVQHLTFEDTKAKSVLKWKPTPVLQRFDI